MKIMLVNGRMYLTNERAGAALASPPAWHLSDRSTAMRDQFIPTRLCLACGKPLFQRENEKPPAFARRRTCGNACAAHYTWRKRDHQTVFHPKLELKNCERCGIKFKPSHRTVRYCSRRCAGIVNQQDKRSQITLICEHCGSSFETAPSNAVSKAGYRKRFCSRSCAELHRRTLPREVTCAHCGTIFNPADPSRTRRFCNRSCASRFRLRQRREQATAIETAVHEALTALGISFVAQHKVGSYRVDVFLPDLNTVIECQGDYFHCNPLLYPDGPIDTIQRHNKAADIRRFAFLGNRGYRVVEVWEKDLRERGACAVVEDLVLGRVALSKS